MRISFYLTRPEKDESGIFASIAYNSNRVKYFVPESIPVKFWDKENQMAKNSRNFPQGSELNHRLKQIRAKMENIFRTYTNDNDGRHPTPGDLKIRLDAELKGINKRPEDLFNFIEWIADRTDKGLRRKANGERMAVTASGGYRNLATKIRAYRPKIGFNDIDQNFYDGFTGWLQDDQRMKPNTYGKYIKNLKTIMNEATAEGINTNLKYKDKRFRTIRIPVENIYLNPEILDQMYKLDLSYSPGLEAVRDWFIIGCYTGQRFSDLHKITPSIESGFIYLQQEKTGKRVSIPLHSYLIAIFNKYGQTMPRLITPQRFNEYIREIAKKIPALREAYTIDEEIGGQKISRTVQKWELISSHTMRRSFATNEFLAGTPAETIMAITGHSQHKDFMSYLKLSNDDHARHLKRLWDDREGGILKVV